MSRSLFKLPYSHPSLWSTTPSDATTNTHERFLRNRATCITVDRVGSRLAIYNGIRFIPLTITREMLGQKVGEFAPTRRRPVRPRAKVKGRKS